MRRSICYTEPATAHAGEINTWKFVYTPSSNLPKGTKLKFDIGSKGRDIDWEVPDANPKGKENLIYGVIGKKAISPKVIEVKDSFVPHFEFTFPEALPAQEPFTIYMGSPKPVGKEKETKGNRAQVNAQRRRTFNLWIDPSGKGKWGDPETFTLDVRGGELSTIKILTPSYVIKNKRFDIILRFEDEWGNLTNQAPEDTLIELSYENLRENLNWKLFVPETGFIALPNLYFNEAGVYTIKLLNAATKEEFFSSPIKCFNEGTNLLFWGLLHGESERYDSTESIENCLRHFRDERAFNFYGVSPMENVEETPNEVWKSISQNVIDFNEDDRFVTFLGFQWEGDPGVEGTRLLVFGKENRPIIRKKDSKSNLKKIYKSFSPKELLSIPTFTMGKGYEYNFKDFDPDFERVVEIYNSWGSSECTKKEGNPLPIESEGKNVQETAEGSIQKALEKGYRFGFVAGGLDDRGFYAPFFEGGQVQYPPGLTAIIAPEFNRASLMEALYNRSCYATTGEKIILGVTIAGIGIGQESSTAVKHGLNICRHVAGFAAGNAPIQKIEIIRNGKVIKTFEPEGNSFEFTYDDLDPLSKITITPKDKKPPFVYYYIRVTQDDGHMAWSSPIWIDYVPTKAVSKHTGKKPVKVLIKPEPTLLDEEEEEDDFNDFDDEDDEE